MLTDFPSLIKGGGFNGFPPADKGDKYRVQIGAFAHKANAEELAKKAKAAGFDAKVIDKGDVDGDGEVTVKDAREILRAAVGLEE